MRSRKLASVVPRASIGAVLVAGVMALAPLPARAEPIALGEAEFVERAARADPRGAVLDAEVDAARAEVRGARVLANPSLSYDREETFVDGQGAPENFLRLGWTLDLSGRRGRRIAASEAGVAATRASAGAQRVRLALDARRAYRQAAFVRQRAELLRGERAAAAALVATLEKRTKAGDAAGYDLQRLELELGSYDDLVASAEAVLELERGRLAMMLGQPSAAVDATDPVGIPALADAPLEPAAIVASRLDHVAARLRARQADAELAAARRGWVPLVGLSGGLKTVELGAETAVGYLAGISLSLPLFDRGQADAARALAARRHADAEASVIEQRVPALVRLAQEDLARRVAQVRAYEDAQLGRLAPLTRAAEAAYREGERSISELIDAYRAAREVRLRALELRRDAAQADLDLMEALGRAP